jgi:hypothetical protein
VPGASPESEYVVETSESAVLVVLGLAETSVQVDLFNSPKVAAELVPQQNCNVDEFLVLLDRPTPFRVADEDVIELAAFVTALSERSLSSRV